MSVKKVSIDEFLLLAKEHAVLDVRSPAEYQQAHLPGAHNLPLFSDEERKIVGTAYKQQNRQTAIKSGLDFFGLKMRSLTEQAEKLTNSIVAKPVVSGEKNADVSKTSTRETEPANAKPYRSPVLIHCWRGGMRSAAVAWLLDLYGFEVFTLAGGYKAYRQWVLLQLQKEYDLKIIGGYTGSGKTLLLQELQQRGKAIVDIEALANHKGSALGGLGKGSQPRQEMLENLFAEKLFENAGSEIFVEDESQRIGDLQIPITLWRTIRKSPVYFFEIPFEARLDYITEEYGKQPKDKLVNAIMRIQKRLGGLETKSAIGFLLEDNYKEAFRILLHYYDKYYLKGLYNRENAASLIFKISAAAVDAGTNIGLLEDFLSAVKAG